MEAGCGNERPVIDDKFVKQLRGSRFLKCGAILGEMRKHEEEERKDVRALFIRKGSRALYDLSCMHSCPKIIVLLEITEAWK